MTTNKTRRILLITSCGECVSGVRDALAERGWSSEPEAGYDVQTLPTQSVFTAESGSSAADTWEPCDLVIIDWSESVGERIVERLALETNRIGRPIFIVLADDVEAVAGMIDSRLSSHHILLLPRCFDAWLLRQGIRFAISIGRMQSTVSLQKDATRRLAFRSAEIERRAEELERWKKEFLANVSHELRTPMNAILGYSRLLMDGKLPARFQRQVREIHSAGNNLLDLINNIIDFTKLSGGEIRLSKTPFHVRDLAAELIEHYRPAAEHKGLRLECHVPSDVPAFLLGDKHRYRQVLASLVSNAVKFTDRGEIVVRLTLDEAANDQVTLRAVVTDAGVGIASDREETVFQEFSQGDGSTTRNFGGLGLGLAVAKRLVDLMGGQIGFRSVLGDGTSFWVALPFEKVGESDSPAAEAPTDQYVADTGNPDAAGRGRRRILAVDRDATQRVLIDAFLSRTGCLVDAVSSVDDAVTAAKGLIYDLAFVEIPDATDAGVEPIRLLRSTIRQRGRHTPIIAVGCGLDSTHRRAVIDAGANGHLRKPFDIPDLISTVGRYLPLRIEPSLEAEVDNSGADEPNDTDDGTSWADAMVDLKRALTAGDYVRLEARTGAMRRRALKQGSEAAADGAMRLQVAVRSGDGNRITLAMERLDRIVCSVEDADTAHRAQFQNC